VSLTEQELRERIDEAPGDPAALRQLAQLVGRQRGRKDEAVALWLRYLDVAPGSEKAEALLALGRAQVEARRYDEAIETLTRCTAEDPRNLSGLELLGELLRHRGLFEEAVGVFKRAVELEPEAVQPRVALVSCFDALGRPAEAEAVLAQIRGMGTGDPAVLALVQELMRRRE
jgi:tetratricopeptide (TPR) repeat protein